MQAITQMLEFTRHADIYPLSKGEGVAAAIELHAWIADSSHDFGRAFGTTTSGNVVASTACGLKDRTLKKKVVSIAKPPGSIAKNVSLSGPAYPSLDV